MTVGGCLSIGGTDKLLNELNSGNMNSDHEENEDLFMETVPTDLDMDMVDNERSIGIEEIENRLDGMEKVLETFLDMRLQNSDKNCKAVLQTLKNIHTRLRNITVNI